MNVMGYERSSARLVTGRGMASAGEMGRAHLSIEEHGVLKG